MIVPEPLHDHGFAHAAVAVDSYRRHSRATRVIEEQAQTIESLFGSWIENPTTRSYCTNAPLIAFSKEGRGASAANRICHALLRC